MAPTEDSDKRSHQGCSNDDNQFIQHKSWKLSEKADELLRKKQEAERRKREQEAEKRRREKKQHTNSI
jgi:hypothetical protein